MRLRLGAMYGLNVWKELSVGLCDDTTKDFGTSEVFHMISYSISTECFILGR